MHLARGEQDGGVGEQSWVIIVMIRRMVTGEDGGDDGGGDGLTGGPGDHAQHPVANGRPSRHQGPHGPPHPGLDVLQKQNPIIFTLWVAIIRHG